MYYGICEAIQRELKILEDKYSEETPLNSKDLDDIDKMAHALKCLTAYEAMQGNSERYGSYDDGSYARGRSRSTGRYVSRDSYEGSYRNRY